MIIKYRQYLYVCLSCLLVLAQLAGCGTAVATYNRAATTSSCLIMALEYMKSFKITITNH
jgi:hypothetical protein